MWKRIFKLFLLALILMANTVWAGNDCSQEGSFCVGLVTDVNSIDDRSFNQSAWQGLKQAAKELNVSIKFVESKEAKDYLPNIELFARNGYKVVITVGFGLGQATLQAAGKFPDIKFIGIDQFQAKPVVNVAGLIFREDKAGFQAGALAALVTKTNTIAAVFGTNLVPPIVAFNKGYAAGARYINPDIKIISTYHPGGLAIAFSDPEWGAATAKQAIAKKADVLFCAGGTTGNGALIEAAGHANIFCIGVDTDQWHTLPEARPCLVSSALKQITPGVFALVKTAKEGRLSGGNFFGDVGLASFHDFNDRIPISVQNKLAAITRGLRNDSIRIGDKP